MTAAKRSHSDWANAINRCSLPDRGVLPSPSVFDRTVHQPLCGFTNLAGSDVEVFQGERASWPPTKQDWVQAIPVVVRKRVVRGTRCFDVT